MSGGNECVEKEKKKQDQGREHDNGEGISRGMPGQTIIR